MQQLRLKSYPRESGGKKTARKLRAQGEIPAILYGHKREPLAITVPEKDLWHILHTSTTEHLILNLDIEGSQEGTVLTLVRDVQHHPVTGGVLHLDLVRISIDEKIKVGVPIELTGVAKGVKDTGGVLDHGIRELTINVKPMEIPEKVSVDVSPLAIGDSLHVSDLAALYPHIEIVDDPHVTIAHVSAPKKLEVVAPEPGAAAVAAGAEEGEAAEGEEAPEEKPEAAEGEKEREKGKGRS
jgi:large subunit ribosomal protein L25